MLRSFYTKLAVLFLLLMVGLGVFVAYLSVRSFDRFANETEQKLNRSLGAVLSSRLQPLLGDEIEDHVVERELRAIRDLNPRIEVYLLDPEGMVLATYVPDPGVKLHHTTVDLAPVRSFVAGADPPVLGTDPAHPTDLKPFSAAPIEIMGKPDCFVYVILRGAEYASVAGMVRGSYIVQAAARGLALSLLVAGIVGLVAFGLLTRRLRAFSEVVGRFAGGSLQERSPDTSQDEIGQLSTSFNKMADTIVENVEELQQVDRQRRELIANVSHDLRSPLASIQGYLETVLLKGDRIDDAERRRYLEIVLRNTESLGMLVGELFELSKLDARQTLPAPEPFSVGELVQDLVLQFRPDAEKKGITLTADLPGEPDRVSADIALIERALNNLIDNAIRFTPAGGSVRVGTHRQDGHVEIVVADTGEGIPESELQHIFERSYRIEKSRSRDGGGAGLGLAIASKVVELHNAKLEVESEVGRGTTFRFRLPALDGPSL